MNLKMSDLRPVMIPPPAHAHVHIYNKLVSTCGNSTACLATKAGSLLLPLLHLASLLPPPPSNTPLEEACSATQNTLINMKEVTN